MVCVLIYRWGMQLCMWGACICRCDVGIHICIYVSIYAWDVHVCLCMWNICAYRGGVCVYMYIGVCIVYLCADCVHYS